MTQEDALRKIESPSIDWELAFTKIDISADLKAEMIEFIAANPDESIIVSVCRFSGRVDDEILMYLIRGIAIQSSAITIFQSTQASDEDLLWFAISEINSYGVRRVVNFGRPIKHEAPWEIVWDNFSTPD